MVVHAPRVRAARKRKSESESKAIMCYICGTGVTANSDGSGQRVILDRTNARACAVSLEGLEGEAERAAKRVECRATHISQDNGTSDVRRGHGGADRDLAAREWWYLASITGGHVKVGSSRLGGRGIVGDGDSVRDRSEYGCRLSVSGACAGGAGECTCRGPRIVAVKGIIGIR